MAIKLGSTVKDKITGYKGIAIGRTEWLNGCVRIGIQLQKVDKDGKPVEAQWFDEDQVIVLDQKYFEKQRQSGGPMADPSRRPDPSR